MHAAHLPSRACRPAAPAGHSREAGRPYPLLLLNDGQNLFEDATSFSGRSWRAAEAAAAAVASGELPPFLVAGIDHAGVNRSLEFLPYKPGSGPGGREGLRAAGMECCWSVLASRLRPSVSLPARPPSAPTAGRVPRPPPCRRLPQRRRVLAGRRRGGVRAASGRRDPAL